MSSRSQRNSVFIDSHGSNPEALKEGFAWIYQLSKENEDKQHGVLAVNTKRNLENIQDTMEELIGSRAYRSLQDDNRAVINHLQLSLVTNRIRPSGWRSGPALVIYPSQDLLDTVDGLDGVTDVLIIPWHRDEVETWIKTWAASELGGCSSDAGSRLISDPVLEEALEMLHRTVNVSSGVTHSSDRSSAIELFEILRDNGVSFDPADIRAWLVGEKGWDPEHADDVMDLAEGVLEGKGFRYESGQWADDIMETLQDRAS